MNYCDFLKEIFIKHKTNHDISFVIHEQISLPTKGIIHKDATEWDILTVLSWDFSSWEPPRELITLQRMGGVLEHHLVGDELDRIHILLGRSGLSRLAASCGSSFLGQQDTMNIGQHTSVGDSHLTKQPAQLLIVPDGKLNVTRDNPRLLVIPGRVPSQLKHLQKRQTINIF